MFIFINKLSCQLLCWALQALWICNPQYLTVTQEQSFDVKRNLTTAISSTAICTPVFLAAASLLSWLLVT